MVMRFEGPGGVVVLVPVGRLDAGTAHAAEAAVHEALAGGGRGLVFDFSRLDYISSAGLRVLLSADKRLRARGGRLVLCGLNPPIRDRFRLGGFDRVLAVAASRDEAMGGIVCQTGALSVEPM